MSAYKVELLKRAKLIQESKCEYRVKSNRTPEMLCLLCQRDKADQRNSHIIPKFLTKEILKTDGEMYVVSSGAGDKRPALTQDTPKEDFLMCKSCERYLGVVEDYFKDEFYDKLWTDEKEEHFEVVKKIDDLILKKSKLIYPGLFNLFVHSIMWRLFISRNDVFKYIKVNYKLVERLRKSLFDNKVNGKNELISNAKKNNIQLIKSKYTLWTCERFDNPSEGYLAPYPCENPYSVVMNRFQLIISFVENPRQDAFGIQNNNTEATNPIKITIWNTAAWIRLTDSYIDVYAKKTFENLSKKRLKHFDLEAYFEKRKGKKRIKKG